MLSEAIRRHTRGEDVVIGIVESHGRKGMRSLSHSSNPFPAKLIEYKGTAFEEMDVDAILARRPTVALVDELAHTNIPGSKHRKRYEDIQELLAAKIDVLSTLTSSTSRASLRPFATSPASPSAKTVPDWVPMTASETVMVDPHSRSFAKPHAPR